nr:hypothetical protein [Streptomyces achromogenes]
MAEPKPSPVSAVSGTPAVFRVMSARRVAVGPFFAPYSTTTAPARSLPATSAPGAGSTASR